MKQDLVTGKIKSIDRNKGRIEIYLKNGLTTTASYLYDIATLRENMNVLVALVNGSYVILNQVENVPRVGTSYSVRRPVVVPPNSAFEYIPIMFELREAMHTYTIEFTSSDFYNVTAGSVRYMSVQNISNGKTLTITSEPWDNNYTRIINVDSEMVVSM